MKWYGAQAKGVWNPEQDTTLRKFASAGLTLAEIAITMTRKVTDVRNRAAKLKIAVKHSGDQPGK